MSAPPGSAGFRAADVARLPPATLRAALAPGPSAPPLEDVAAALSSEDLFTVARALDPSRGERLLRLAQRPLAEARRQEAADRLVRGLFWPLVYELEPDRWAELAELEVLPEALLADLPEAETAVEVGAGSGRLTRHLAARVRRVLAVEGSLPLCRRLRAGMPASVTTVAAATQSLPLATGCADLATSCASLSPDPPLGGQPALRELERVTRPGGWIAIVGPEAPEWFASQGFERRDYEKPAVRAPAGVLEFFGPLDPPGTLLLRRR